jgi:hypothetical protein
MLFGRFAWFGAVCLVVSCGVLDFVGREGEKEVISRGSLHVFCGFEISHDTPMRENHFTKSDCRLLITYCRSHIIPQRYHSSALEFPI